MDINHKFIIWCAKKCLHLWYAPRSIIDWLNDPENFMKAIIARPTAGKASADETTKAGRHAAQIAWKAIYLETTPMVTATPADVSWVATWAANALNTTIDELKYEFLLTLTDEELETTDPEWIEYATVEVFAR